MQGSELTESISRLPSLKKFFRGVYSINTLPKNIKKKQFLFCNTAKDFEIGEHWLCFVKISSNHFECFNSLGFENNTFLEDNCNFNHIKELEFNCTQVQQSDTKTCGLFVLYFAIHRMHNLDLSFKDLLNEIFSTNVQKNEQKVKEFLDIILK